MDGIFVAQCIALASSPILLLVLYIYWNDRRLTQIPPRALYFSPKRHTAVDIHAEAERLATSPPIDDTKKIPPKTGRRYIVVGGVSCYNYEQRKVCLVDRLFFFFFEQGGFVGGWIITKLLKRGEDFHRIRLLDLNPPSSHHPVVKDSLSKGAQFIKVDVTDPVALQAAFAAPWPDVSSSEPDPEITVFHTAANIRFYERHLSFLGRSTRINVQGTKNVVSAAQFIGATVLIYTSSGSVGLKNTRFLLWPWEKEPEMFLQVLTDDDAEKRAAPRRHEDFFSNYAASKMEAETFVRASDKETTRSRTGTKTLLRTGCIRPGNGIFGPGGDQLCGAYLMRQINPSWIFTIVQSFCYVENCAVAHLLYEQRLIELLTPRSKYPDIGGQAFCITDPGPTPTNGDVYTVLETLSEGECHFPSLSPTAMLLVAHTIEFYYRIQQSLSATGWNWLLPKVNGDLINLQPSLFSLVCVHLVFDDSRARLSPEKGGLGYVGAWTTTEALHKTYQEHKSGLRRSVVRSRSDLAGVGLNFSWRRKKATESMGSSLKIQDKVGQTVAVSPVEIINAE
jgi:nucleoside-diphosphate-sugar epimerase